MPEIHHFRTMHIQCCCHCCYYYDFDSIAIAIATATAIAATAFSSSLCSFQRLSALLVLAVFRFVCSLCSFCSAFCFRSARLTGSQLFCLLCSFQRFSAILFAVLVLAVFRFLCRSARSSNSPLCLVALATYASSCMVRSLGTNPPPSSVLVRPLHVARSASSHRRCSSASGDGRWQGGSRGSFTNAVHRFARGDQAVIVERGRAS